MFNIDELLTATFTGSNSTALAPIPVGIYNATCSKVELRQWQSKTDPNKAGYILSTTWKIDDDLSEQTGRDSNSAKYDIFLDVDDSGISKEQGKNVKLGKLRSAVGLNDPDTPFALNMLEGQSAQVIISHRSQGEEIYAEVKGVMPLGM